MQTQLSFGPRPSQRPWWLATLVGASLVFSLGFACAVPFAAFGAVAALTMNRRDAFALVALVWLANQAAGFGVLHYPWTVEALAWGGGLLLAAILAALAARIAATRARGFFGRFTTIVAFLAAFVAYEGFLFAASAVFANGVENFALAIVARIFSINALAFVGLLAANQLRVALSGQAAAQRRALGTEPHEQTMLEAVESSRRVRT